MAPDGIILYLCNYVTEYGNVAKLFERSKLDDRLLVRRVDLTDEHGNPNWPGKYVRTDADLKNADGNLIKVSIEDIKKKLGPQVYNAEMMNSPIDEDSQEFYGHWFQTATRPDVLRMNTRRFALIDSAMSKRSTSDNTGVARVYVDANNKWYVSARKYKFNAKELIDLIFTLHEEGFEKIGIEETAYTEGVKPYFEEECRKRNKYPRVVSLKHGGVAKETRIRGLIPRYANGDIFHIYGECDDLELELVRFPKSKNDDVMDALAYGSQICEKPYITSETSYEPEEAMYEDIGI
jgi:phage terminase large subunit-like protein